MLSAYGQEVTPLISDSAADKTAAALNDTLWKALWDNDPNAVRSLLTADVKPDVNAKNQWGHTPITHAATNGNIDDLRLLLAAHANPNIKDTNGNTPLINVAMSTPQNALAIAQLLIKSGALLDTQNAFGYSALMKAVDQSNIDLITLLVSAGADINLRNEEDGNKTAIDYAIWHRKNEIQQAIDEGLAKIAERMKLPEKTLEAHFGKTPGRSAKEGSLAKQLAPDISKFLSKKKEVTVTKPEIPLIDFQDRDGMTSLMSAAQEHNITYLNDLIKRGANITIQDKFGFTALMHAVPRGLVHLKEGKDCIIALLNAGANPYIKSYDEKRVGEEVQKEYKARKQSLPSNVYQYEIARNANQTFFTLLSIFEQPDPDIALAISRNEKQMNWPEAQAQELAKIKTHNPNF